MDPTKYSKRLYQNLHVRDKNYKYIIFLELWTGPQIISIDMDPTLEKGTDSDPTPQKSWMWNMAPKKLDSDPDPTYWNSPVKCVISKSNIWDLVSHLWYWKKNIDFWALWMWLFGPDPYQTIRKLRMRIRLKYRKPAQSRSRTRRGIRASVFLERQQEGAVTRTVQCPYNSDRTKNRQRHKQTDIEKKKHTHRKRAR